jgi:hypothetical protein
VLLLDGQDDNMTATATAAAAAAAAADAEAEADADVAMVNRSRSCQPFITAIDEPACRARTPDRKAAYSVDRPVE